MDLISKARSEENKRKPHSQGRPFKKGQSGNPGGRPKKLHITNMFEAILSRPENRKELESIIMDILKSRRMASVLLLREIADRTEGKVSQEIEVSGQLTTLSDTDLEQRLAKLLQGFGLALLAQNSAITAGSQAKLEPVLPC